MKDFTLKAMLTPDTVISDPLTEMLRAGARELIAKAVEAELQSLLSEHAHVRLPDGRQALVRNGYLPERTLQTGIGDVNIKVPKIRDRRGSGVKFNSALLPPYLKRSKSIEELLPWLYLKRGYQRVTTLRHCRPYWENRRKVCRLTRYRLKI